MQYVLIPSFGPLLGKYAGGVRVDENFKEYLFEKLVGGEVGDQNEIEVMLADGLRDFQRVTKLEFLSPANVGKVRVGIRRLNDDNLRIKRGVMSIPGCDTIPTHSINGVTSDARRPGKMWKHSSFLP
jgi:hypothetical protein